MELTVIIFSRLPFEYRLLFVLQFSPSSPPHILAPHHSPPLISLLPTSQLSAQGEGAHRCRRAPRLLLPLPNCSPYSPLSNIIIPPLSLLRQGEGAYGCCRVPCVLLPKEERNLGPKAGRRRVRSLPSLFLCDLLMLPRISPFPLFSPHFFSVLSVSSVFSVFFLLLVCFIPLFFARLITSTLASCRS